MKNIEEMLIDDLEESNNTNKSENSNNTNKNENVNISNNILINKYDNIINQIENDIKITKNNKNIDIMLNVPWTEKYRPKTLEDLVLDNIIMSKIKKIISDKDLPNIIISGSPGVGKTSAVTCIARCFLGKHYNEGFLELNASDERGIKYQNFIINFCKIKLNITQEEEKTHKIILLDEADNMTVKAQQSINNIMEQFKNNTRFIFTCNDITALIESIQSRCVIFRFCKPDNINIQKKLNYICKKENIKYTQEALSVASAYSQGDLRCAINIIHNTYNTFNEITKKNIYKLSDKPKPIIIKNLLINCYLHKINEMLSIYNDLYDKGYSSMDITNSIQYIIIYKIEDISTIPESIQHAFLQITSDTLVILCQGIDSKLQIVAMLLKMASVKNT